MKLAAGCQQQGGSQQKIEPCLHQSYLNRREAYPAEFGSFHLGERVISVNGQVAVGVLPS